MPTTYKKKNRYSPNQKKRLGLHHKKTKKYHTTYHPFIPILFLIIGLFFSIALRTSPSWNVLAFATEVSAEGLLEATNTQRERDGAKPLMLNDALTEAAQKKAEDMAQRNYWSHETPDGEAPWIFIDSTGYQYSKAGENLAYGFMSSDQTITGWMNSDSHRENMLDSSFTEVGFGYVNAVNYQDSDKETIVVALYALPATIPTITMTVPNDSSQESTPSDTDNDKNNTAPVVVASQENNNQPRYEVSRVESLLDNRYSWATFALGIISGGAGVGFLASHGVRLRKWIKKKGHFVVHHPLLDVTLLSLALFGYYLLDGVGYLL